MVKKREVTVALPRMKDLMYGYLNTIKEFSTDYLGKGYFLADYEDDSKHQTALTYRCIKSCNVEFDDWIVREMASPDVNAELMDILLNHEEDLGVFAKSPEYNLWLDFLQKTGIASSEQLGNVPIYAKWWEIKVRDGLEKKIIKVVSVGKKWRLGWNKAVVDLREETLLIAAAHGFMTKIKRAKKLQARLTSGKQIPKLEGLASSAIAVLQDGASWQCLKCSQWQDGSNNFCGICGEAKP